MGLLFQAKNGGSQFSKYNFHATNEKLCHGVKGHPFFLFMGGQGVGGGNFFSNCVWCGEWIVHYSLFIWTIDFPSFLFFVFFEGVRERRGRGGG
jgi:hypothetical protein